MVAWLRPLCQSGLAPRGRRSEAQLENGFAFCGANAHRVDAIVPVKQLITGLKEGYALASFVGGLRSEIAKRAERLQSLRKEYSATLAAIRGSVRGNWRRFAAQNEAMFEEERARLSEKLSRIKAEHVQLKVRIREMNSELGILLGAAPSLAAV